MKILIINNASFTCDKDKLCIDLRTGDFAMELKKLGNSISFFQFKNANVKSISVFKPENNNIDCIIAKEYKFKIVTYVFAYIKLLSIIRKFDFIYIFYPCNFKFIVLFAKLIGKKTGYYIRGMKGLSSKSSQKLYKKIDVAFTVSDHFTQFVNQTTGKNIANTIKPMINYSEIDIISNREYRNKDTCNILFLGRMDRDKGVIELLNALSKLIKMGYTFKCTMVGDGSDIGLFKSMVIELNLSDIVTFEGAISDRQKIKKYYLNADCYILPTYHEGFPRTLYEAMIFGTPIVTTFVGGIGAIMKDGVNCKKIDVRSVDSIVNVLTNLQDNYFEIVRPLVLNAASTVVKIVDSKRLTHAQHLNKIINNK